MHTVHTVQTTRQSFLFSGAQSAFLAWIWRVQCGVGLWQPPPAASLQDTPCLLAGKSFHNSNNQPFMFSTLLVEC